MGSNERFASRDSDTSKQWEYTLQEWELHSPEAEARCGPNEWERESHWAGVRASVESNCMVTDLCRFTVHGAEGVITLKRHECPTPLVNRVSYIVNRKKYGNGVHGVNGSLDVPRKTW